MTPKGIVGLDLSLTASGIATLAGERTIISGPTKKRFNRYDLIWTAIKGELQEGDLVVIEGYAFGAKGQAIFQIAELGGIIRYNLWKEGFPFVEVAPACLKKYVLGKGGGKGTDKKAMLLETYKRTGMEFNQDDNQVDAFWLRQMGQLQYNIDTEIIIPMPVLNREAMSAVEWL